MKNKLNYFILTVIGFLSFGCSTAIVKTTAVPENLDVDRIGIVYYLPKALIPISIISVGESSPGSVGQNSSSVSAQVTNTITINGEKVEDPNNKQEGTECRKCTGEENKNFQYAVTMGDIKYLPDTRYPYFLEYKDNVFFDDDLDIEVGPNQLLNSINTESSDKTGEIFVKVVDLASTITKMSAGLPDIPKTETDLYIYLSKDANENEKYYVCDIPKNKNHDLYLDLTQDSNVEFSINALNKILKDNDYPIKLNVKTSSTNNQADEDKHYSGVLTRSPIPYIVTVVVSKNVDDIIKDNQKCNEQSRTANKCRFYHEFKYYKDSANNYDTSRKELETLKEDGVAVTNPKECLDKFEVKESEQKFIVMAPNDGPVNRVDISRSLFVEKTENLTFTNGMLNKIDIEKPSQALGFISIPVDMAKAIAEIPASLFTLKVEQQSQQAQFYESQAKILESLDQIRKKQENLPADQEKLNTSTTP